MDKLLAEALVSIISYLHESNRLNCALVCKRWHSIITKNSLLYQGIGFSKLESFQQALTLFEDKKDLGAQVKQLLLAYVELV